MSPGSDERLDALRDRGGMPAPFLWHQPVSVRFGAGAAQAAGDALGPRRALVLAFTPAHSLGIAAQWRTVLGERLIDWIDVDDGLSTLGRVRALSARVWPQLAAHDDAVMIAIGGGTTLDLAKVLRCRLTDADAAALCAALRGLRTWPPLALAELWLVPTTAGTGSEVTRWATIWDTDGQVAQKRSFDEPFGYAERAFVDPTLCASCPHDVTRDCGLDALAHALESIWNRHANPISDALALAAAQRIVSTLPSLLERPDNAALRAAMSLASLEAGLAFAQTRTALAHALSYAVTLEQGLPHGHACAMWLPTAWELAQGVDGHVDDLLGSLFDGGGASALANWLRLVGIDPRPEALGLTDVRGRIESALRSPRGGNFIGTPPAAPEVAALVAS